MTEQEIYAKALEIAVLIKGPIHVQKKWRISEENEEIPQSQYLYLNSYKLLASHIADQIRNVKETL